MDAGVDGNMLFGYGRTAVGATIIDEDDLDITIGLVENTANGTLERALGVVEGQYDADLLAHFFSLSRAKNSLSSAAHSLSRTPDTTAKR